MTGRSPGRGADDRRRFAARRRRVALQPLRRSAPLLGGGLVLAGLGYLALGTGALAVRTVEVSGTERLSAEQVRSAVTDALHRPLLTLDLDSARADVLALPGVERVQVSRVWPSRLRIAVVERQPLATVHRRDGWWLVDRDGVVFGPPGSRVRGLIPLRLPAAAAESTRPAAAVSALSVLTGLPADLRSQVTALTVASREDVRLELRSGSTVAWGSPDRSPEKARILRTLLRSKASVYDVSSPTVVTTR